MLFLSIALAIFCGVLIGSRTLRSTFRNITTAPENRGIVWGVISILVVSVAIMLTAKDPESLLGGAIGGICTLITVIITVDKEKRIANRPYFVIDQVSYRLVPVNYRGQHGEDEEYPTIYARQSNVRMISLFNSNRHIEVNNNEYFLQYFEINITLRNVGIGPAIKFTANPTLRNDISRYAIDFTHRASVIGFSEENGNNEFIISMPIPMFNIDDHFRQIALFCNMMVFIQYFSISDKRFSQRINITTDDRQLTDSMNNQINHCLVTISDISDQTF